MSAPADSKALVSVLAPDPIDAGALLRAACDAHEAATGESRASLATRVGIDPHSVSRAVANPDASPRTLRPMLRALGLRVALVPIEVKP